ncbi:DNA cross-link repair 1A protein [Zeugodacus cucurbitae]|uniref:DNA cross-link repair 1A protein n=1 Tax=Zeugodacus cucurbitae TaxID=28588 RepID=UPI0023D94BD7|nr:DNA cross-link repair 1A protein [Zeugodacus cucurbitae]
MIQIEIVDLIDDNFKTSVEYENKVDSKDKNAITTPLTRPKRNKAKKAATTTCKRVLESIEETKGATQLTVITENIQTTTKKRTPKFKDPPPSQLRIDSFFKSSSKSYKIESLSVKEEKLFLTARGSTTNKTSKKVGATANKKIKGRKRLFKEGDDCSSTSSTSKRNMNNSDVGSTSRKPKLERTTSTKANRSSNKCSKRKAKPYSLEDLIDLCSDEEGLVDEAANSLTNQVFASPSKRDKSDKNEELSDSCKVPMVSIPLNETNSKNTTDDLKDCMAKENAQHSKYNNSYLDIKTEVKNINKIPVSSKILVENNLVKSERVKDKQESQLDVVSTSLPNQTKDATNNFQVSNGNTCPTPIRIGNNNDLQKSPTEQPTTSKSKRVRKFRACPPYKKIAGTTFAVDAFQYGQISGVTHYFLTHFHADHYQGLTRKFEMPLYVSPITANLVRALISVENKYIHEIELNESVVINDVEVTAIDANHCPGAVMFVFKLASGQCIVHTGDFRASPDMESEPIFWNNNIDTIYLDTTYIAHKHNFSSQYESIDRAKRIIQEFREKRPETRVLFVVGSYVIGKERFWANLAQEFNLKVWTEKNRLKALQAMDLEEVRDLLCDDPHKAEMHVISIAKVSYQSLVEYFRPFKKQYDAVLAFRPSGWEKNGKPQLRGEINIVGIEYSEHSSHAELERFVTYLKPREVISTVPVMQGNPCITPKIPEKWYKYVSLKSRHRNFQPSITSFLKMRPRQLAQNASSTKLITNCVTPTKSPDYMPNGLSQLSVRAMATCIEVQRDNKCQQEPSLKVPPVITLFPESDALEDWLS